MKREKIYLLFAVTIILASGGIIYLVKASDPISHNHPEGANQVSQQSVVLLNQITQYKRQLESDPGNFNILVSLGNNYYDLNNAQESIKYYEKALEIRPNSPEVLVDCGVMYRQTGQYEKALQLFKKATELAPGLAQAYYNLGVILYVEKNDKMGAAEIWREFLTKNPSIDSELKKAFEDNIEKAISAN